MASSPLRVRLRSAGLALAAAAVSGALLHLGTGLRPIAWLTWFAALPVAWAAPRLGGRTAFGAAAVAWAAGALNELGYLRSLHLPAPAVALALLAPAVVFGAGVALQRAFVRRGAAIRAAIALPAVWVSYELVQASTASHGTFGSLAYTQVEDLPVLQLASVLGIWGVTFAVLFLPAASAVMLSATVPAARRVRLLAATAALAAAVLGFGLWRLRTPPPGAVVTVGLAASDARAPRGPAGSREVREALDQAEGLARSGAQVVLLPEKLAELDAPGTDELDADGRRVAARTGATLVVGVARRDGSATYNEARVYRSDVPDPSVYRKRRLLPGWESRFTPGTERLAVPAADGVGRWGLAICKDMDFPATGRAYRSDGLGLMLVPAWDFGEDGWLHARMAAVRGVEGGFGVVRSARQGLLTVSDARGRVVAERPSGATSFSTLLATVSTTPERTLYSRLGDAFGWACLAAVGGMLVSLRPRRRPAR